MAVITISRQFGCGGAEIGRAVADALGAQYIDRSLIVQAAQRIGVPEDMVSERDERIHGISEQFLEDIGRAFTGGQRAAPARVPGRQPLTDVQLFAVTRSLITEVARTGNAVIVGRGAQMILHEQKDALHVHIVAPVAVRIEHITRTEHMSEDEARAAIRREDTARAEFLKRHFGADWADPLLYDMILNTGRLSQDAAVQLIVFRAAMLHPGVPSQTAAARQSADAAEVLTSLRVAQDSIRAVVNRYRR